MKEETKKYLIIGGGLVIAIAVGIIVYKKYEASAGASQAAADQSTQDELAYLEAQSMDNAYAGFGGGGGVGSIGVASPPSVSGMTFAQEIASIEQAFGFGPPASSPNSAGAPTSGSAPSGGTAAPAGSPSTRKNISPLPLPPQQQRHVADWHTLMEETPADFQREGVAVA